MMRKTILGLVLLFGLALGAAGCGKVNGPRFWWDDKTQTRLPDDYQLPDDVSAASITEQERRGVASGGDITDEQLDSYNTNLDLQEEKRKSEAALFDF